MARVMISLMLLLLIFHSICYSYLLSPLLISSRLPSSTTYKANKQAKKTRMPTLRSIGVDAQLCTKLAAGEVPITTPLALLSRDAATTAQQLQVPLSIWQDVRLAVADALLIHSCSTTARIVAASVRKEEGRRVHATRGHGDPDKTEEGESSSAAEETMKQPATSLIVGSMTALEYWKYSQSLRQQAPPLTVGCNALNPWLQSAAGVIQFTGPHSSGKTQVCLDMAMRYAASSHQVYYLTSTTPPPVLARRLRQLVASTKLPRQLLDRIELVSVTTPYELLVMLQKVKESLVDDTTSATTNSSTLLILDSASACLLGCRWDMTQQVTLELKALLHLHGVAIVVANGISAKGDAALGPTWNNETPQVHIRLQEQALEIATTQDEDQEAVEDKVIRATLERHPHRAQLHTKPCDFHITAQGVTDVRVI